ncbi:tetracycline resistance [Fusarium subglutinans]|uniref:Tetracycline resistance n=1 Tax=Gibberella subglutinans TaxID=42677 RepID=A0A8H5PWB5_GIBSU|nr:tetracycline resistance [Fusarium subglutinans]KAF5604735.1 tetracycline resistance [Fusarium subglutinans]
MAASSTATIGSYELTSRAINEPPAAAVREGSGIFNETQRLGSRYGQDYSDGGVESVAAQNTSAEVAESWKYPRQNVVRTGAAFWSLLTSGANDAAYGALIPYLEEYYNLSYIIVSLVFLSPFVGYILAAVLNNTLHRRIGQRGIGITCGICHIFAYIIIAVHPPYPVLVLVYCLAGFGNGISDAAWNAWIGNLDRANETLGFLHAFYGAGGVISPLIATNMIAKADLPWYTFYYVMIGLATIEFIACTWAFWSNGPEVYRQTMDASNEDNQGMKEALFKLPFARMTWLCAAFLLCYVGVEVSVVGWIVQFMIRVRKAENYPAGMTSMGFWLGLAVGRAILGFVTPLLDVKVAVSVKITIGFAAAFGGSGAAILPFAVGAIAQAKGVKTL